MLTRAGWPRYPPGPRERRMSERLGNVFHWMANSLATLLLLCGTLAAWHESIYGTFGRDGVTILSAFLAFAAWLSGRICLYVLADH
jgi:hypothetical protein